MKQNQNDLTTTQTLNEKWDHATLANNFIFYKVMRHHPQACKQLLELLLGIKISQIEITNEETIEVDYDSKGIRLDVYVKDTTNLYDIELQIVNTKELPERARYYQGLMDLDTLKTGEKYKALKNSHVIFICMEDIFNHKMPIYTFENLCLENNKIKLNDRSFKHFFIAPICAKVIDNKDIRDFFNFLISNKANNKFTSELHNYVADAKHNMQWRIQYMTYERQRAYDLEEGMNRQAIEDAKSFYQNGVSIELIAKSLKMTEEEIKEIVKDVVPVTAK
ncbi:MAG: Rpn family recombination-promoting nuclease/putative transposase [Treponema sp.]|nr:Rpn family recombination-promoting nuclease/putative transposase [Treponema sp.]